MKKIITILLLLIVPFLTAQEIKHLNLEDAVLGSYRGLYPEQKSLQWIEGTDDYIITENNIVQVNYNLSKRAALFSFDALQKSIPSLKAMPNSFSKVTSKAVYFYHNNAHIQYNYIDKKVSEEIKYPEKAENMEFNLGANAIAYC